MPDRKTVINIIAFAFLILTAFLTAMWISDQKSNAPVRLGDLWSVAGENVSQQNGRLLMPPGSSLQFNGLSDFHGNPFEITYRIDPVEYDRLIFVFKTGQSEPLTIETSLEAAQGLFPPSRINIAAEDGAVMYYEDGKPVRRYLADIESASSVTMKVVGSRIYVTDFLVNETKGKGAYHESFVVFPTFGIGFIWGFGLCLAVLLILMIFEKRIALSLGSGAIRQMALHGIVPFTAALISPFSGFGKKAMIPALSYFALSRLAFIFKRVELFHAEAGFKPKAGAIMFAAFLLGLGSLARKAPAIAVEGINDDIAISIAALALILILGISLRFHAVSGFACGFFPKAAAVFSIAAGLVFLSSLLPPESGDPIRAIGLMSAPLAIMVILSSRCEPVRFYNVIMFFAALAMVVGLELALRYSQDAARLKPMGIGKQFEKHDLLLWAPVGFISEDGLMQQEPYRVPKIAFRSGDATPQKPKDVFRIVTMGGSNVWGDGIENPQDTFSAHMEKILRDRVGSKKVEVLNAGVKSFSSLQVLVLLKHYVVKYHPDMAVFYILRNDLTQNYGIYTLREMYEMAVDKRFRAVYACQRLLQKSKVYNGLTGRIVSLRRSLALGSGEKQLLKQTKTDDDWRYNIEDIIDVCEQNEIQPVFVIEYQGFPHAAGLEYRQSELEQILIETANKRHVPLLDANRHFYLNSNWEDIVFAHDTVHLNPEGHKQVGQFISDFLIQEKLLPE